MGGSNKPDVSRKGQGGAGSGGGSGGGGEGCGEGSADPGLALAGLLVVDKPPGMTSARAVAGVKRRAGGARTGHAGTLDPLATGVLVIGIGRACTRLLGRFMDAPKRYRTTIDLSAFTTTDDLEGERTEIPVETPPDERAVRAALARFVGTILQRPPPHSAVKIGGRRAYALARAGKPVEPEPREVTIHAVDLVSYVWPRLEIDVRCAKGVYIRSLARDAGVALGTGGHCVELRRTAVGPFTDAEARALDDLPPVLGREDLIDPETAVARLGAAAEGPSP